MTARILILLTGAYSCLSPVDLQAPSLFQKCVPPQ